MLKGNAEPAKAAELGCNLKGEYMVRYHDNNGAKAYETDESGMYADNWDPNGRYGDEYADVHFRVNCPSYYSNGQIGFSDEAQRTRFYQEAATLLKSIGWDAKSTKDMSRGKETLFLHPQDISGEVRKDSVKRIAEALSAATSFSVYYVDIYETLLDIEPDNFARMLESKYGTIVELVKKTAATKRRNLFKEREAVAAYVAENKVIRTKRVGEDRLVGPYTVEFRFVNGVIDDMIRDGSLVESRGKDNMPLIRTA